MDVKVPGVTYKILSAALRQAKRGRQHILKEMDKCRPPARCEISPLAPHIKITTIDGGNVGRLIGPGGKNIRAIEERSNTTILVDDTGEIEINGPSFEDTERASELIQLTAGKLTVGQVIKDCIVVSVKSFGVFVNFAPGRKGLVHISEISTGHVKDITTMVKVGDRFDVQVISCNSKNECNFSRRALLSKVETAVTSPDPRAELKTKPEEVESTAAAATSLDPEDNSNSKPEKVESSAAATSPDPKVESKTKPEKVESSSAATSPDSEAESKTKPEEVESSAATSNV